MQAHQTGDAAQASGAGHDQPGQGEAVFHVNERKGRIAPHGEDLTGGEVLSRVQLTAEKYELWTVEQGRTGELIQPEQIHHVSPGDHYRATIRGTNYSSPDAEDAR